MAWYKVLWYDILSEWHRGSAYSAMSQGFPDDATYHFKKAWYYEDKLKDIK